MKRRIILVLAIVVVLGMVVGSVAWLYRRGTGPRLLSRAQVAMRAGQFDKALELARTYAQQHPKDWTGHYYQGRALSRLGKYDEARKVFVRAAELAPDDPSIPMALATTYFLPARRVMLPMDPSVQVEALKQAAADLVKADEILAGITGPKLTDPKLKDQKLKDLLEALKQAADEPIKAKEILVGMAGAKPADVLDALEQIGLNQLQISRAWDAIAGRLEAEAKIAQTAGDDDTCESKLAASAAAGKTSSQVRRQTAATLLYVVRQDAARGVAARTLIQLCLHEDVKDYETLAKARKAIEALEDPPAIPALLLTMHDLRTSTQPAGSAAHRKKVEQTCQRLEALMARDPEEIELKLARAELAMRLTDADTAEKLVAEVLKADPDERRARLMRGELLLFRNKAAEAERELYSLKDRHKRWPQAHYAYGRAAMAAGRKGMAVQVMRDIVKKMDPTHAGARMFLADHLLSGGYYDEAFQEAQALYDAYLKNRRHFDRYPGGPRVVSLFVRAAVKKGLTTKAEEALKKALKDYPSRPDMLNVVADGYASLGQPDEAKKIREVAAGGKADTLEARLGVVRALRMTGRLAEAEKMLQEEMKDNPNEARIRTELARLYLGTGRNLQAIEQYREAVRLNEGNMAYRLELARALFNAGNVEESKIVLDPIDPNYAEANLLRMNIRMALGETIGPEELPGLVGKEARAGLPMAMAYMHNGRPEEAVKLCLAELKNNSDSRDATSLLAHAYAAMGETLKSTQQWRRLIKISPREHFAYRRLAEYYSRDHTPDQVSARLRALDGALPYMVDRTIGWLLERMRRYAEAADVYAALAARLDAPEDVQCRARLQRAYNLARLGRGDAAIIELNTLGRNKAWHEEALYTKAGLLFVAKRPAEADGVMAELVDAAVKRSDTTMMIRLIRQYAEMKQTDKALALCDQLAQTLPNDARPHLVRADVSARAGRLAETAASYEKAIAAQPGNFGYYRSLSRTYDALQEPGKALKCLEGMAKVDQTGRAGMLFEQGILLARWGLQAQAIDRFEQLAKLGYASSPRLQLNLGRAFAALGQKGRARQLLAQVPPHARDYVGARRIIASLADTTDEKLRALDDLDRAKPGLDTVLTQRMVILLDADRPADAVKAFRAFVARRPKDQALPVAGANLAFQIMLRTGDRAGATDLILRMASETPAPRWRRLAILMTLDAKPAEAASRLGPAAGADFPDAVLGLIIARKSGADGAEWIGRIDAIERDLKRLAPSRPLPPAYGLLIAVATKRQVKARAELARFGKAEPVFKGVATTLMDDAAKNAAKAQATAIALLTATVALDLQVPDLARAWAMELLKDQPTCRWAAGVIVRSRADPATHREVLNILKPPDCALAHMIRASVLRAEGKFAAAADAYGQAARAEKGNLSIALDQAMALEKAGKADEAIALYLKVWAGLKNPAAANNAAYMLSQRHAKDSAKLAEALALADEAVKAAPQVPAFRDTKGWIAYLLGQHELACEEIQRAVRRLPDSAEVHCHLGLARCAAKQEQMGRWHLAAAVDIGEKKKARGETIAPAEAEYIARARKRLAELGPTP